MRGYAIIIIFCYCYCDEGTEVTYRRNDGIRVKYIAVARNPSVYRKVFPPFQNQYLALPVSSAVFIVAREPRGNTFTINPSQLLISYNTHTLRITIYTDREHYNICISYMLHFVYRIL